MPVPVLTDIDAQHLARAVELAGNGLGRVHPNPLVGAVIVRDGVVLGEGWHEVYGGPHAEVNAIAAADGDTDGATLYVSLEPCCHQGKTGPCTAAITAAGIARVVVAADDPAEHAAGRGLGMLRDDGIEVEIAEGSVARRARLLNQGHRKHARTGRPFVLFKSAMSLDGKVATATGDSKWISGELSRERAHRWRSQVDAVVVGIGTALADDPRLTARVDGVQRQPRRVVFDSLARLPLDSQLIAQADEVPLTVVVSRAAPRAATDALHNAGADVLLATGQHEPARIVAALDGLGQRDIKSMLLEGGPHLAGAFLDAGEIDELRLFVAPVLVGSRNARDPLEGVGAERIGEAVRASGLSCEHIGDDVLLTARLAEW